MAFADSPALTINEIRKSLTDVNRATVYRTVNLFEQLGIINRVQLGWKHRFELSDQFAKHHHHLTCTICHTSTDISDNPELDKLLNELTKQNKYLPKGHHVELQGICQKCLKHQPAK